MKYTEPVGFITIVLVTTCLSISLGTKENRPLPIKSLVGVIMDSKCAITGSHDPIMERVGAKDARDCTLKCARNGSFELFDPDTKAVYQLDDQQRPKRFAGRKVKISGPYEDNSQTFVEIDAIEPVP